MASQRFSGAAPELAEGPQKTRQHQSERRLLREKVHRRLPSKPPAVARKIMPLLLLALVVLGGCSSRGEGAGDSGDSPVTLTVRFREDVTPEVMEAFFDGFNAGSFGSSPSDFSLSIPKRQMTATYSSRDKADPVLFFARTSASVADAVIEDAERSRRAPKGK